MQQPAINSYGLIGNMRTAALVGPGGSLDWLCVPNFDSPSIFAAILDPAKGGRFQITADGGEVLTRSFYYPDTNVLCTRLLQNGDVGELIDFMPASASLHTGPRPFLVRMVRVEHGSLPVRMRCAPAFDYARRRHSVRIEDGRAIFESGALRLVLDSTLPLRLDGDAVVAEETVPAGQWAVFALHHDAEGPIDAPRIREREALELLEDTVSYWKSWIGRCTYRGRWREHVKRSALALKLLTFEPTGAIVAAPTTSLPEHIGGGRNWDYRYVWLRDAAFTVYALLRIGFLSEAAAFMQFIEQRCHELEPGRMLRPLYGIDGRHQTPEEVLPHLSGYRGSGPVRIGNAAIDQLQLDVVGSLMDAVYVYNKNATPISHDLWKGLSKVLDWTCEHWQDPDHGIWEIRGEKMQFVYSKLMCWVAMDRGLRLQSSRGFPGDASRWRQTRDRIYERVWSEGYNHKIGAFTQAFGGDDLDAATLLMPLMYFVSPQDPRCDGTLRAIQRPLKHGGLASDFLIHRYNPVRTADGISEPEGAFNICTFWLAEALARAGRMDLQSLNQARLVFERMLGFAGPLGLFSEETSPEGLALGNYPQALTHLSLITAALHIDRVSG